MLAGELQVVNHVALADCLGGTCVCADAAFLTLGVVDAGTVVDDMDGIVRALLFAELAADAAVGARGAHDLADIRGGTADVDLLVDVAENDQVVGTGLHAETASDALGLVHASQTVDDHDCILRTDGGTVPEAETAVGADLCAVVEAVGGLAGLDSLEFVLVAGCVAVTVAEDDGYLRHDGENLLTGEFRDFCHGIGSAGLAEVDGSTVVDDGSSVVGTSGVTAGTAVDLGQFLADGFDVFVPLDFKNPGAYGQQDTGNQTDGGEYQHG